MPLLLVIDDEPNIRYSLARGLGTDTLEVITAETGRQGIDEVKRRRPDAVLLDVHLPDMTGLAAFLEIRKIDPRLPVIIMTAFSTTKTAIEATKNGAFDYLIKPVDLRLLSDTVDRALALSRLSHVPVTFDPASVDDDMIDQLVGRSPAMQSVYKAIGRVAAQDVTVLIEGESGTGKELVARAIYQHSRRSHLPFLAVNTAAIPDALLESEMFGHERGSFTGADRLRIGKFEQAQGGTLFLDEVGEMSPATQAKLLRVLQERTFERVGGNESLTTDVRVIAATNKHLDEAVEAGAFRRDLYYRLNVVVIRLPPLRERREDIPSLVDFLIRRFNRELGRQVFGVAPDAMRMLTNYDWPGNVRELQSAVKSAIVHAAGDVLTVECFPQSCRESLPTEVEAAALVDSTTVDIAALVDELCRGGGNDLYRRIHGEVDRLLFDAVMRKAEGNQLYAAELLGISRTTLRAKLRSLGFTVEKQLLPESDHDA